MTTADVDVEGLAGEVGDLRDVIEAQAKMIETRQHEVEARWYDARARRRREADGRAPRSARSQRADQSAGRPVAVRSDIAPDVGLDVLGYYQYAQARRSGIDRPRAMDVRVHSVGLAPSDSPDPKRQPMS